MESVNRVEDVIKKYPKIESIYHLNFCDISEHLEKLDKEADENKIKMSNLPMGLTCMEDTIKFRCYNNDILDVMIKNKKIDIETLNKKLTFINDYKKYLSEYDLEQYCKGHEKMLKDFLSYRIDEVKFLTELIKKY